MPTKQHFNTVEDKRVGLKKEEELAENQVELSDGRIIEMRETTGADEMVVSAELGDTFATNGGGMVIFQSCLIAKSIDKIDNKPVPPMRDFSEYRDFMDLFRSKDWSKIRAVYLKLNDVDASGNGLKAR